MSVITNNFKKNPVPQNETPSQIVKPPREQSKINSLTEKMRAQGISLIPDSQPQKNTRHNLIKAEKLYAKAELLSKHIEKIQNFIADLKNPKIPGRLLLDHLLKIAPKKLVGIIEDCIAIGFPNETIEKLRDNPHLLLQMKNSKGECILDVYLAHQKQKLTDIKEMAGLYISLTSQEPKPKKGEEKDSFNSLIRLQSKKSPFMFDLKYILSEGIEQTDKAETFWSVLKLHQLQDFYRFLNCPEYTKKFIYDKFEALDYDIKTVLGHGVWAACYHPNENFFADHLLANNPFFLLDCKDSQGRDVVIQLMDHFKAKITLQRFYSELVVLNKKLETTSDREEWIELLAELPEFALQDLYHLVWLEHGGQNNPKFANDHYGKLQIEANPLCLLQRSKSHPHLTLLDVYMETVRDKIQYNILRGAEKFSSEMQIPKEPIDCSIPKLAQEKLKKDVEIPKNTKVAMVAAEFAGVISMGGLAQAVTGMARAHGTENVCAILPKYDVINPKLILKEKKKYQIEYGNKTHNVYKAKINGMKCYFIENDLFNVGYNDQGKPNNIYEGEDLEVKRRWAQFQSLSAEFIYKLSKREKNPVELVHVHDAQTALIPRILATRHYGEWKEGTTPATVFTFHNNASPICFNYPDAQDLLAEIELPSSPINSFVEGLETSDMNTTVSENFAKEVQSGLFGNGMERYTQIHAFKGKIAGIVNGNSEGWNPKTDPQLQNWVTKEGISLDLTYGPDDEDLAEKIKLIREQLVDYLKVHKLGDFDPTKPILLYVGRYDPYQKGIDKLPLIMQQAIALNAQFICIGTEHERADAILGKMEKLAKDCGNKGVCIIRDEKRPDGRLYWQQGNTSPEDVSGVQGFGSLLRAGVDLGVFPSIFEPCGLVQGEMHRMGIKTIATETGGFADTIFESGPNQNGYLFERDSNWSSIKQDYNIRKSLLKAITHSKLELKALYANDQEHLAPYIAQKRTIMRNAANSSWTSTFDGSLSPIDRIRWSYAKAIDNQKKRGTTFLNLHGLEKID